jgi:glycolate oxidase iron-sulfur subunit
VHTELAPALADTHCARHAKELISSCVHCGFCLATCPTYKLLGSELDSPRGRIYLIKQMLEGAAPSAITATHLDRCLTCRSCETTCPSGVQYGRLLDIGRGMVEASAARSWRDAAVRRALVALLSRRRVFAATLQLGRWLRPLLPQAQGARIPRRKPGGAWPAPCHPRRVVLLRGCVQPSLAPNINSAAARVLDRIGISALTAAEEVCCGALSHHLGGASRALQQARRNVSVWARLLDEGAEAIVVTASGCAVMVKEYAQLLREDPLFSKDAARVSAAARDLCEVVLPQDVAAITANPRRRRVAWQSPCTLQHGQKILGRVESLLRAAGCSLTAVADAHLCCGSAGSYSILQRDLSRQLRAAKLDALQGDKPELIATANIGCLQHLAAAAEVPVRHWVELLDDVGAEKP